MTFRYVSDIKQAYRAAIMNCAHFFISEITSRLKYHRSLSTRMLATEIWATGTQNRTSLDGVELGSVEKPASVVGEVVETTRELHSQNRCVGTFLRARANQTVSQFPTQRLLLSGGSLLLVVQLVVFQQAFALVESPGVSGTLRDVLSGGLLLVATVAIASGAYLHYQHP
mgnify:CR=1 FL=1